MHSSNATFGLFSIASVDTALLVSILAVLGERCVGRQRGKQGREGHLDGCGTYLLQAICPSNFPPAG
jgi:hypothetical protein